MFSNNIIIFGFILFNAIVHVLTLIELPTVEDNNIADVAAAIRNTVNNLFAIFKINNVTQSQRIKQFSTIHNFFVSITLQDCDNLKEIARLTRVNNIDNDTQHFIAQINEVLNEDDKSNEVDTNNVYVTRYINMFIRKLRYLKDNYVNENNTAINADVLKYLNNFGKPLTNFTGFYNHFNQSDDRSKNVLTDNQFWAVFNGRRIFEGIRTNIKTFPFMASVQFFQKFQCAGSIIKSDLIITSSSCLQLAWNNRFFRENPAFLSVQIGSDFYQGGGENIGVINIYFHPNYDPKNLRHNLAIMRLTRKINFRKKNKRVRKIDFDRNPWPLPSNTGRVTVVGWGARDSRNVISNINSNKLSYAEMDIYPHSDCRDHYTRELISNSNFCAGFFTKGSGACNRDAGGPGIIEDLLMGVISFGSPICGAPDAPTVFTKLGYYTDWIETIMEEEVPHRSAWTTTISPPMVILLPQTTTKKASIQPLAAPTPLDTPTPLDKDHLRLGEQQFKDFLATMFKTKEPKGYNEAPNDETSTEINDKHDTDMEETHTFVTNVMILETATEHPSTALILGDDIFDAKNDKRDSDESNDKTSTEINDEHTSNVKEVTKEEPLKISVLDTFTTAILLEDDILNNVKNVTTKDAKKRHKTKRKIKTTTKSQNLQINLIHNSSKVFEQDTIAPPDLDIEKLFNPDYLYKLIMEDVAEKKFNDTMDEAVAIIKEELDKYLAEKAKISNIFNTSLEINNALEDTLNHNEKHVDVNVKVGEFDERTTASIVKEQNETYVDPTFRDVGNTYNISKLNITKLINEMVVDTINEYLHL